MSKPRRKIEWRDLNWKQINRHVSAFKHQLNGENHDDIRNKMLYSFHVAALATRNVLEDEYNEEKEGFNFPDDEKLKLAHEAQRANPTNLEKYQDNLILVKIIQKMDEIASSETEKI